MYNSIYLVSHSILNYERLTEERKEPPWQTFKPQHENFRCCLSFLCVSSIFVYL